MRTSLVVLGIIALILALLAGAALAQSWPVFRANVRGTGVVDAQVTPPLALVWKFSTLGERAAAQKATAARNLPMRPGSSTTATSSDLLAEPTSTPASDGTRVFFAVGKDVFAVDLQSGSKVWHYTADGLVQGSLAVEQGLVVLATAPVGTDTRTGVGGSVLALSTDSGKLRWQMRKTEAGFRSSPVIFEGKVFIGCDDSNLYALDLMTGRVLWQQSTGGCILGAASVDNDRVFIASTDGKLYCLSTKDGQQLWVTGTHSRKIVSAPCLGSKFVFLSAGQTVSAYSKRTGTLIWSFPTKELVSCTPALADGVVYFGDESGRVYAVSEASGEKLWTQDVKAKVESSPLIVGRYLLVRCAHGVVAMLDRLRPESELMEGETRLAWSYRTAPSVTELLGYAMLSGGTGAGQLQTLLARAGAVAPGALIAGRGRTGYGGDIAWGVLNAGGAGAGPGIWNSNFNVRQGNVEALTGISGNRYESRGARAGALAGHGAYGGLFGQTWGGASPGLSGQLQGFTGGRSALGTRRGVGETGGLGGLGGRTLGGRGTLGGRTGVGGRGSYGGYGGTGVLPQRLTLQEEIQLRRIVDGAASYNIRASLEASGQDVDDLLQSISLTKHVRPSSVIAGGMVILWGDDGALYALKPDYVDNEPPQLVQPEVTIATANPDYLATYMIPDPTPEQQLVGVAPKLAPIPGRPPLTFSAVVFDEGSGVNPAALRVSLDGKPYEDFKFDPRTREVKLTYSPTNSLQALSDGTHTFSVVASDWAGNLARKEWTIQIDNSVSPPEGPAISTTTAGTGGSLPGLGGAGGMPGGMGGMGMRGGVGGALGGMGGLGGRGGIGGGRGGIGMQLMRQ